MIRVTLEDAQASREKNLAWMRSETGTFPAGYSVMDAIRRKCLDCSGFQQVEVADCHITRCALWPYRMGRNPFHAKAAENMAAAAEQSQEDGTCSAAEPLAASHTPPKQRSNHSDY
jgi:hypothetical protein